MSFKIGTGRGTNASNLVKLGRLFYFVTPNEHTHQHVYEVPDYVVDAMPFFMAAVGIEFLVQMLMGLDNYRTFYVFNNVAGGILQQLINKVFVKSIMYVVYCYIYEYFRLCELPWDSVWTWYFGFIFVDFMYYWFHRISHECNIVWASHQVHHSSEDYTLTTALRQSVIQNYFSGIINLPMAFFVPPSIYLIHAQFNLLYQFWIHTELVGKLGPLEYILNTASHHRVHHGRNPYCIDKNYGGTLIIWDRLFNTFAEENEKVAYGLVHMNDSANPFYLQLCHFYGIFKRVRRLDRWSDKLGCIFRGPAWLAECEKIGLKPEEMELPEVEQPARKRDMEYFKMEHCLEAAYVTFNFFVADIIVQEFFARRLEMSVSAVYVCMVYIFFTLTTCGYILERRWFWTHLEVIRILGMFCVDAYLTTNSLKNPLIPDVGMYVVRFVNIASLLVVCYKMMTSSKETYSSSTTHKEKKDQ